MADKEIYNGFEIFFDKEKEEWFTQIKNDGGEWDRIGNVSLKKLKESLDVMKRSKFERIPCFVSTKHYRYGGGRDEKYLPHYCEATITSVSPNGNAWVVRKGEKHSEKHGLRWSSDIIMDTPENRKLIKEFEEQAEIEFNAEKKQNKIREKLQKVDGAKLYKSVYSKDIA